METFHAWSNAWKYDVKPTINQRKIKHLVKRLLYVHQNIIISVLWWLLGFQRIKPPLFC